MTCNLLDFRCIFVNELVGSVLLSLILFTIFYFILASRMRFGFDTTIAISVPLLLLLGLAFTSFSTIYAVITIAVALGLAFLFDIIIGNK